MKNKLSITQGVFGAITSHDDIGDNHVEFASGFNIDIFYDQPSMDLNEAVTPLVSIQSDEKGFYEHELETGEYCICTRFRRCAPIVIHENEMLRLDYELSTGPGWSLPNDPERALEFSCKKP
ncbi:hypothetical protein [Motilimonas sp. 1_MG-2023]|uniref:hypothetical protein n=1 Tax=Motilimonas TaxID=1914248 RepID=UPI0026E2A66A|nr:hypothetical protein [Motilimonas sp. 1_MG-2023]MDO6526629.1 hypothetical protein [Motilimonas sp. 1_MG-2023]